MTNIAIILASGTGTRFGGNTAKQFSMLADKMVVEYSLATFNQHADIDKIILVTATEHIGFLETISAGYSKVSQVVAGGDTRQASSAAGVATVRSDDANVLIHDAARPLVSAAIISRCIAALQQHQAVNTVTEVRDTVMAIDADGFVASIPKRASLRLCQTPQAFKAGIIRQAHAIAAARQQQFTDDCSLVLSSGLAKVFVIAGEPSNIKLTYPEDVYFALQVLGLNKVS